MSARILAYPDKRTNLGKFSAARSPKPFFSVRTMSIGAYCLRWNLEAVKTRDLKPRTRPRTVGFDSDSDIDSLQPCTPPELAD
jgi:hypothetical protein